MMIVAPDYYKDFRCIAGDCRHSCCIGWEIDIDPDTAGFYQTIEGDFGEKIRKNMDFCKGCYSIRLCENERCPFLNEKGLCDIIINLGEDALCDICTDHPRFRNYFYNCVETGLGLCCEAAAKLILDKKDKVNFITIGDNGYPVMEPSDDDLEILEIKDKLIAVLQDRSLSIDERIEEILKISGASLPQKSIAEWVEIYLGLERLDEKWTEVLEKIKSSSAAKKLDPTSEEQLLVYFIFRHFGGAIDNSLIPEGVAFAVLSLEMIRRAADFTGIYEAARLYSSEIEYSDENIYALLEFLIKEEEVF